MIRVALPVRPSARTSAGMRAYARALRERLPVAAPDIALVAVDAPPLALPFALRRTHAALVHLPFLEGGIAVPRPYTAMVHDVIHLRLPHLFSARTAAYWRFVAAPCYRGAARLIVSDERVADDCVRYLGARPERIRVVPLGYALGVVDAEPWRGDRPYLFYAGNHRPHKGLETLYAAWHALPAGSGVDLVVTGPDEPLVRARFARPDAALHFAGNLGDDELARRYRGALAYVQPSLSEGFGIPALEAAVAGVPVIATISSVPRPVAPYATTFEAGDARALTSLLEAIVRDPAPARERAAEGAAALRAYTWDRFAAATAAVFREVACS